MKTTSQTWLVHSLEVLAVGGVFTGVVTAFTAAQAGGVTLQSGSVLVGSAVVAFLSNGLKGMANNTNTVQTVTEGIDSLQQSHQNLIGQFSSLLFHLHAAQSPALSQPVQSPSLPLPLDAQSTQQNQQIQPGLQFTTSIPQAPPPFIPMPNTTTTFIQPPQPSSSYVPPQPLPLTRDWTGMVPTVPPPPQETSAP